MPSAYSSLLGSDVILDVGVFKQGSTLLGATRGGATLTTTRRYATLQPDGVRSAVVGLDRPVETVTAIEASFLPFGASDVQWYESQASGALSGGLGAYGLSSATAYAATTATMYALTSSTPGVPDAAGALLPANRYLADFRWVTTQGDGGTLTYVFAYAKVVESVALKGIDGDFGEVRVKIEARLSAAAAAASTDTLPYTIEQA